MQKFSKTGNMVTVVFLIVLAFFSGMYVKRDTRSEIDKVALTNKETIVTTEADFAPFWEVWNSINEKYPETSKITDQEKVYGAISGLVGSLKDPYSVFFEPEETKEFEEEISGNFSGIGIEVGIKDNVMTVIAPLKDTPAYRVGLKSGDRILQIDKKSTSGIKIDQAIKLIRGEKGTIVTLTVLSEGEKEPREIPITRDTINIPTLDTELRNDGVFIIKLYSFSANSPTLFRNALLEFSKAKTDKLILDLRGNPGGYLHASVDISSWFLPSGKVVVTEDYGKNKDEEVFRSKGYDVFKGKLKFVILINGGSASASEIVAGALQDHKIAKLVGDKSFGKGSVQELIKITSDTRLKITVAKWLTPNGNSISEKGLTPDYEVKHTKKDAEAKKDPQLDKAIDLLLNWK